MKLLRIKGFQETACFKKPFAFKVGETYPLPPFSTVKGMLHSVLGATSYIPFQLSIQGKSESMLIDYQRKYMYKPKAKTKIYPLTLTTEGLAVDVPELDSTLITTMPMYEHLLYNFEFVLHVGAEEAILEKLYHTLETLDNALVLGRGEDVVRIDGVEMVEVEKGDVEETAYHQFVPIDDEALEFVGAVPMYRLPKKYEIKHGRRQWEYVVAKFVPMNTAHYDVLVDKDGYSVFLMK